MLKIYKYNGLTFQFEEGTQPEGAVEVKTEAPAKKTVEKKAAEPKSKAVKPANKARKAATK